MSALSTHPAITSFGIPLFAARKEGKSISNAQDFPIKGIPHSPSALRIKNPTSNIRIPKFPTFMQRCENPCVM
jgi:hypothetical protein